MKQWYTVRSKPRREFAAATLLTKAGIEVYVPMIRAHKQHGKPPVLEPLFPSYFFSRLDPFMGEIRLASYTPGVRHVIGYDNQPWPVPDELVSSIQERLAHSQGPAGLVDYRHGERLIITQGPLRDVEAIFDRRLSATGRVRVLIRILERYCPAEIHVAQLRRAGKATGSIRT